MIKLIIATAAIALVLSAPTPAPAGKFEVEKTLVPMDDLANIGSFDVNSLDCADIDKMAKDMAAEYAKLKNADKADADKAIKALELIMNTMHDSFGETIDNKLKIDTKSKAVFVDLFSIINALKNEALAHDKLSCDDVKKIVKAPLEKHKEFLSTKQYKDDAVIASKYFASKSFGEDLNKILEAKLASLGIGNN